MRVALGILAFILLFVPVVLLVIFDLPGLGVIAAILLMATPYVIHQAKLNQSNHGVSHALRH